MTNPLFMPPPPGPPPGEDATARFASDPFGYLQQARTRFGPLFTLPLGNIGELTPAPTPFTGDWVFLTTPSLVQQMYESDEHVCSAAQANKIFFGTDESSVAYIDGPEHRLRRRRLLPSFGGRLDHSSLVSAELARHAERWPCDRPFALFPELQRITASVITTVVCGAMAEADQAFIRLTLPVTEDAASSRYSARAAETALRSFIGEQIAHYRRRRVPADTDTLAYLIRLADRGDDALTDEVIRDEAFSLLYTGFSTTANTLAWAVVRVLSDDLVLARLRAEVMEESDSKPITRETVGSLPYLDAVIRETLRLHPVTALNGVRLTRSHLELDGYRISAGSVLVHCAYLLQRSPDVYDDPHTFRPDRFLVNAPGRQGYAWAPFGGGHHACVGRGFAMQSMKVALAHLTRCAMKRSGPLPTAQLQGFFMAPSDGATVYLTPSSHSTKEEVRNV